MALSGARGQGRAGGDLRAAYFPAPAPPGLQVPEVRLGGVGVLKLVTFKELCSFDSESSEKKILSIKYVFLLRIAVCGLRVVQADRITHEVSKTSNQVAYCGSLVA